MNKSNEIIREEENNNLIKDCLGNDREAFNRLVLKYKDKVFNLCFRLTGDYDEANDCAQDVFIKVYGNIHNFKFQSAFSTWLYRITVNTCKNHLSSLNYRVRKSMASLNSSRDSSNAADNINQAVTEIPDNSANPEKIYVKKESDEIIQNAINSMPQKEKILILLRDIEGKSYEEIVEITGFKIGTVKSKLARARHELRDMLRGLI